MDAVLFWLIGNGSYGIFFLCLFVNGFGVPIPEDLVLIAGGVLAQRGFTSFPITLAVCFVGVLAGDFTLFTLARSLGTKALERRAIARVLTRQRRDRIEALITKYGGLVVFVGRHMAGFRPPVFVLTAVHGMERWRFMIWDALGLCITAPLVLTLGYYFSDHLDRLRRGLFEAKTVIVIAAVAVVLVLAAISFVRSRMRQSESPASKSRDP